jgi:hypothetical protein
MKDDDKWFKYLLEGINIVISIYEISRTGSRKRRRTGK